MKDPPSHIAAMAVATATSAAERGGHHRFGAESLSLIDTRLLSQQELLSLSLSSSSTTPAHLHTDTDISTSKIDGSVLNVSAGSRKQTFSRLRLAPPRNYQLLPPNHHLHDQQDQESLESEEEDSQVISLLGSIFGVDPSLINSNDAEKSDNHADNNNLISIPISHCESPFLLITNSDSREQSIPVEVAGSLTVGSSKRKRGRPPKIEREICQISKLEKSSNDVPIDDSDLLGVGSAKRKRGRPQELDSYAYQINGEESSEIVLGSEGNVSAEEDPYGLELKRRTVALRSEAELFGFLEELGGEWVSARKKRKIVDAAAFGDRLPHGWMLVLCLRRRGNDLWVENSRYIRFYSICLHVLCDFLALLLLVDLHRGVVVSSSCFV